MKENNSESQTHIDWITCTGDDDDEVKFSVHS